MTPGAPTAEKVSEAPFQALRWRMRAQIGMSAKEGYLFNFDSGLSSQSETTWSVSDLTRYIQELFDIDYRLKDVQVEGEISNFTRARSGHLYFTLKDTNAQLKCVMWRSAAERLALDLAEGDAIVARGRVSVYEKSGLYQLYVDHITTAGRGDLAVAFEELKRRLQEEGLFSAPRKPLPSFPRKIGVVTSADAAALRDILNVLRRRCPMVSVLIAPTLVQGAEAPAQIIRALRWLDGRDDIDVIIIARGGGSIEDLWAFNDEAVARAIFDAQHPIISGVGHETDFTIADFVADVRAPTPSAAAELSVPDLSELGGAMGAYEEALSRAIRRRLRDSQARLEALERNLRHLGPLVRINNLLQHLDTLSNRLDNGMSRRLERWRARLALVQTRLDAISPQATLQRGYAIVRKRDGDIVRRVEQVGAGEVLVVNVSDGEFEVVKVDGQ